MRISIANESLNRSITPRSVLFLMKKTRSKTTKITIDSLAERMTICFPDNLFPSLATYLTPKIAHPILKPCVTDMRRISNKKEDTIATPKDMNTYATIGKCNKVANGTDAPKPSPK